MRLGEILHRKAYHEMSPAILPGSRLSHHRCHQHVLHGVQQGALIWASSRGQQLAPTQI